MRELQAVVEDALFATRASRAIVQLATVGGWMIVAEAVTGGARQIRNDEGGAEIPGVRLIAELEREPRMLKQDDIARTDVPVASPLVDRYGVRAQLVAPLVRSGRLAGLLSLHYVPGPRRWERSDIDAIHKAQATALAALDARDTMALATTKEDLRDAAIQAILDGLRVGLRVQRCTLRQNVSAAFAFPVTHESRGDRVRSLRGDFTIVQSGQPVIEKMLAERTQVVQNDTRSSSSDPAFHAMLKHYGDMRSQIVTPLFCEDSMVAVLSVHSLQELRMWSSDETALVRAAARMLGLLVGATLA